MSIPPAIVRLLGDKLLTQGGTVETSTLTKSPAVGLYFSAHWCPPCRGFTPVLAKAYSEQLKAKGFEVVFISSDRDDKSFTEYFHTMPWKALSFEDRERKKALSKKFKVEGIPTLIILNPITGEVYSSDGRSKIMEDPNGDKFPWVPPTFEESIGTSFLGQGNKTVTWNSIKNNVTGIYFSAHWCPPCRGFTPVLVKLYNKLKAAGKNFEVIFVSSDRDEAAFQEYFNDMPWLAVPFSDSDRRSALNDRYQVEGIPTLVIVDGNTGATITQDGRAAVGADPDGKDFPWYPKAVNDLDSPAAMDLNKCTSVIVFTGGDATSSANEVLTAASSRIKAEAKGDDSDEFKFFYSTGQGLGERVKRIMGDKADSAVLAILDIPGTEMAYFSDVKSLKDLTADAVVKFVSDFSAGKLQGNALVPPS